MLYIQRYCNNCLHCGLLILSIALFSTFAGAQSPSPTPAKKDAVSRTEPVTEAPKDLRWVFEVGGQFRDADGERPSKFEEYKSIRNGFLLRRGSVQYNPGTSPYLFSFASRNVSERDQQYFLEVRKFGRFRTIGKWDSQPHLYSRGATSLLTATSPGIYSVPDSIQLNLQTLDPPMAGTTVPNPALIAAVQSYVASAPRIDIRSQRQSITFEQRYNVNANWSLRFRLFDTKRFGERPLGTGSYERTGTSIGDTFRAHAIELPAQIDQRTTSLTFGTSYVTRNWGVNFDYTHSNFRNNIDSYIYDNPFRLVDQPTTGTGGAFNRMAFARGLHSAMPDNQSDGVTITAFLNLPYDSRWAGAFGWERWTQDQQFLPYTLNTQTAAPFDATNPANLPEPSLDGEIENLTVDQLFTTRPWKNFIFNARYRVYREENKTRQILFAGYAAFLEGFWRTSIVGSFGTRLIENEPASYTRQKAGGEAIWEVTDYFKWRGEFEWEGWDRTNRQVEKSNEYKFLTAFTFKPTNKVKADIDYRYQNRKPDAYFPGPLENQLLRMFDQAKRVRNDVRLRWQWAAMPKLGIAGDFLYVADDYDENFYGLSNYIERRGSIEMLYNPQDDLTVYANYSREHYNTSLRSVAKTGVPFDIRNEWIRADRNVNDNFGIGLTTYLYRAKWFLDVNYNYNLGRDLITTANVSAPAPSAILNATAYPFPEAEYRMQEFSIDSNYQLAQNVALGIRYLYEPFKLDDWQLNNLNPYPIDRLAPEIDGRKFLLLDSRYSSHNGHIFTVYLRFGN